MDAVKTFFGVLLLGVAIWSFCRAYYFAFYVIERYVDPSFKFSGLFSVLKYLAARRGKTRARSAVGHTMLGLV